MERFSPGSSSMGVGAEGCVCWSEFGAPGGDGDGARQPREPAGPRGPLRSGVGARGGARQGARGVGAGCFRGDGMPPLPVAERRPTLARTLAPSLSCYLRSSFASDSIADRREMADGCRGW